MSPSDQVMDYIGVGIGPSNLSLAALKAPFPELRACCFERKPEFQWHSGLLFPESEIQVSHLKDLVTLVDPRSRYSFLSFLREHGRLYSFINANFARVRRQEFNEYFAWVSSQLPDLYFDEPVFMVSFDGDFVVHSNRREVRARSIVVGTGTTPVVPESVETHLGPTVFHAADCLDSAVSVAGRRVAIVGGGQSAAEVFLWLVSNHAELPRQITWITRRWGFLPLDESAFTNDLFTPGYSDHFFALPQDTRRRLAREQRMASDGISQTLIEAIYRRLYELEFLSVGRCLCRLLPDRELIDVRPTNDGWRLELQGIDRRVRHAETADVVILGTGYRRSLPSCLDPLIGRIAIEDGGPIVREDFSLVWDGPPSTRIFIQNGALAARGVADPNLSLTAWRSAKILNAIAGRALYEVDEDGSLVHWRRQAPTLAEVTSP